MNRLLAALDFSDCSREALRNALRIVSRFAPAELVVLTVLGDLSESEAQSETAVNEMERAISNLHKMLEDEVRTHLEGKSPAGVKIHYTAARGAPAEQIIEQARAHRSDLIVMGTHGRTGLNRFLAGSVAERVVRQAPCSVLTVKPKKTA